MAQKCRWIKSKGQITGAKTESGERSKLFDELAEKFGLDKAQELYAVANSDEFLNIYGNKTINNKQYESNKRSSDRRRWNPSRGNQTLDGAPINNKRKNVTGADPELTYWAEEYAKRNGIDYKRQSVYVEIDKNRALRLMQEYDKMEHNPQDPKVKEAYENLIQQTLAQYDILVEAGYQFYFFDETNDPYDGNPMAAMEELRNEKRMGSFATEAGFGSGATELNVEDNPMLSDTGITWGYGSTNGKQKRVLANDVFRSVHDAFGHGLEGASFRARGEENAWQAHARLFTGSARAAITSETRGQNSWLNFNPNLYKDIVGEETAKELHPNNWETITIGEHNKNAKVEDTIFADQKTGLMPEWSWREGFNLGISEQTLEDVVSFVAEQNENKEPLNTDQLVDLQNFLLGVDNFDVNAFYSEGLFTISAEKLRTAGYNAYEIEKLKSDLDLQEQVKNAVESLKNTSNVELSSTPFENLEKTSEITSFGKMTNVNPFVVEKNVLETLAGETENFDELYNQLEYTNLNKEELRQEVKNYQKVEEYKEVDGQISPRKITETESIIPLVVTDNDAIPMMQNLQGLAVIRLDVLQENSETTYKALDKLEDQLIAEGIDVIGLADKPIDENLLSFLSDLNTFLMNPTRENTKMYADVSDAYFQRDLSPKISAIKKIKENKDYVKLNTTLNEEQVYEQQGLIKVEDGLYIKTAKQPLEELYSVLEQYPDKIPQEQTLEKYVQEQIGEYDDFTNAENAEAVVLYRLYFDVANDAQSDAVNEARNSKGELLAPNGKKSNLNEEQYKLVRTPEFKAWFGDWQNAPQNASKVVDENGEPLVVYHGTNAKFYEFENKIGIRGNQFTGSREVKSDTFFFTDDLEYANKASNIRKENFGGSTNIVSSFLNIRQPLDFSTFDYQTEEKFNEITGEYPSQYFGYNDNLDQWWRLFDKDEDDVTSIVKEKGYNGVILAEEVKTIKDKNNYDLETASVKSFGVFNPNQIKSATEIKGTTSTDTNDIRYLKSVTPTLKGQNFTGDFDYLTNEYVSDFYIDYLREKKKNSKKFKNFYSNFTVNEKGIQLVNDDEITLSVIKQYADENLKQYSLISKQMPNLIEDESVVSNKRDEYINYPQNAPKFEGQSYLLSNDAGMIAKDTTEEFLRVGRDAFELQDTDGNISLYSKLEQNNSDYFKFGAEKTENKVNIADYAHLKTELDNFSKTKKLLKEDITDFDC